MSAPILITGGAGSVGERLVDRFLKAGRSVRVFDLPIMDFTDLESLDGVEILRGDITNSSDVQNAVTNISGAVHLAAILPPNSEKNRDITFAVNVDGTKNLIDAIHQNQPNAKLVFTSSISTYGDTSAKSPPILVDHPQNAIDIYAESKIVSEADLKSSSIPWVILRIASIAVPAFMEPPDPWPFTSDQRVEMIHRDDVVDALFASILEEQSSNKIFNIAGGKSWQKYGSDYVNDFFDFMGAPVESAVFRDTPGWNDWYNTKESQEILGYQNRSYTHFANEMREIVRKMMEE